MTSRDVSKDVVVVLLLLTVIVTMVGTWSVTQAAGNVKVIEQKTVNQASTQTQGFVIANPPPQPVGKVSLTIINPGDDLQ